MARDCERAGLASRCTDHQFRGRHRHHAQRRARVRQQPRLSAAAFRAPATAELRADRAAGRGHAARLLVLGGPPRRRPRAARHRAARGAAGAAPPGRAATSRRGGAGAVRRRVARGLFGHFVGRDSRRAASTGAPRSCSKPPARRCFPRSCDIAERPAPAAGHWRAARSMPRASPRAIARWCAPACCRAMCWAATRRASSASRPPATPAASTICW